MLQRKLPMWVHFVGFAATIAALIPLALIVRSRYVTSRQPRVHVFLDMDQQPRFSSQQAHPLFVDGRAMRLPVAGTVARGELTLDDAFHRGRNGDRWVSSFPSQVKVNRSLLLRGQERYKIYCAPCHGYDGMGQGSVHLRAVAKDQAANGWTQPTDLTGKATRDREVGEIFNIITHGKGAMSPYASQVPVEDRWAMVAYVRALQRSRVASADDIPQGVQPALRLVPVE